MRAQTRPQKTPDPDCRPWESFLSPTRGRRLALAAAADAFLSQGHGTHHARNARIRETKLQGRGIDLDRDDLSQVAIPRRAGHGPHRAPAAPARLLDRDAWNAILGAAPTDLKHRDVLVASAQHGAGATAAIAAVVGITIRHTRNCQNWLLAWAREHLEESDIAARLDDPITTEAVVRRPLSRAGRKRKGAPPRPPRFLVLAPHTPAPSCPRRPYRPRVRRPRFVDFRQMNFLGFEEAV